MISIHPIRKMTFFIISRRLTPEQKALILSYAELDKDVDGTVNGLAQTKTGNTIYSKLRFTLPMIFALF